MEFTNPYLLWSLLGIAIPITLHLLNKSKPRKISIPTVKFIALAIEKSHRSTKVSNITLLLLRILILILLTLFISRPYFSHSESEQKTSNSSVIIVDNSYYTNHSFNQHSQFQEALNKAEKIIKKLPADSTVSIVSARGIELNNSPIRQHAYQRLNSLVPVNSYIDIHKSIQLANSLLKKNNEVKADIYLICDMNKASWNDNYQLPETDHDIYLYDLAPRKGNHAICTVETDDLIQMNQVIEFKASLASDTDLSGLKVQLKMNGKLIEEKYITESCQQTHITFLHKFNKAGFFFAEISLDIEDALEDDNNFYFSGQIHEHHSIYIAENDQQLFPYIKAALDPRNINGHNPFKVSSLTPNAVKDLKVNDLLILSNLNELDSFDWTSLRAFIERGGSTIFIPGIDSNLTKLNTKLFPYLQNHLSLISKTSLTSGGQPYSFISKRLKTHMQELLIHKAIVVDKHEIGKDAQIHLNFSDGQPALFSRRFGNGKVYFLSLNVDLEQSNFAQTDSFALFWNESAHKAFETVKNPLSYNSGETVEIMALKKSTSNFNIIQPTESIDRLNKNDFSLLGHKYSYSYSNTQTSGHYKTPAATQKGFSCNAFRSAQYYKLPDSELFRHLLTDQKEVPLWDDADKINELILQLLFSFILILLILETHFGYRRHYAQP